jgi:hypothetical protein
MKKQREPDPRPPEDCPTAWFVTLERARRTQDFELAARAERELQRLGVKVRYTSAQRGGERHE